MRINFWFVALRIQNLIPALRSPSLIPLWASRCVYPLWTAAAQLLSAQGKIETSVLVPFQLMHISQAFWCLLQRVLAKRLHMILQLHDIFN